MCYPPKILCGHNCSKTNQPMIWLGKYGYRHSFQNLIWHSEQCSFYHRSGKLRLHYCSCLIHVYTHKRNPLLSQFQQNESANNMTRTLLIMTHLPPFLYSVPSIAHFTAEAENYKFITDFPHLSQASPPWGDRLYCVVMIKERNARLWNSNKVDIYSTDLIIFLASIKLPAILVKHGPKRCKVNVCMRWTTHLNFQGPKIVAQCLCIQ